MNIIVTVVTLTIIGLVGFLAYNNLFKSDTWTLVYVNQAGEAVSLGDYRSRDECSLKLQETKKTPDRYPNPSCGSNCEPTIHGVFKCDETFSL